MINSDMYSETRLIVVSLRMDLHLNGKRQTSMKNFAFAFASSKKKTWQCNGGAKTNVRCELALNVTADSHRPMPIPTGLNVSMLTFTGNFNWTLFISLIRPFFFYFLQPKD